MPDDSKKEVRVSWDEPSYVYPGDVITSSYFNREVVENLRYLKQHMGVSDDGSVDLEPLWKFLEVLAPIGLIQPYAGDAKELEPYWLVCDGSIIDPLEPMYEELRTRIGHVYDPDLRDYKLPDLRGRAPIGVGNEGVDWNALNPALGQKVGDQRMQAHSHGITDPRHNHHAISAAGSGGNDYADWTVGGASHQPGRAPFGSTGLMPSYVSVNTAGTGGGSNVPPSLAINFVILAATP